MLLRNNESSLYNIESAYIKSYLYWFIHTDLRIEQVAQKKMLHSIFAATLNHIMIVRKVCWIYSCTQYTPTAQIHLLLTEMKNYVNDGTVIGFLKRHLVTVGWNMEVKWRKQNEKKFKRDSIICYSQRYRSVSYFDKCDAATKSGYKRRQFSIPIFFIFHRKKEFFL